MLDSGAASCVIQDAHRMRHWRGASNIIPWDWCGLPLQGHSVLLFHVVGGQTFSTIHVNMSWLLQAIKYDSFQCPDNSPVGCAISVSGFISSMWPGFKCAKLSVQIEPYLKPDDILIYDIYYMYAIQILALCMSTCLHAYIIHLFLIYAYIYTDTLTCTVNVILFKH